MKITNKNKSCYVSTTIKNPITLKDILFRLLQEGCFHFYFSDSTNKVALETLLNLKRVYSNIQIFIVHNCKNPFWQLSSITNLPIKTSSSIPTLQAWLTKYCDIVI